MQLCVVFVIQARICLIVEMQMSQERKLYLRMPGIWNLGVSRER